MRVSKELLASQKANWTIDDLRSLTKDTLWTSEVHPARQIEPLALHAALERAVEHGLVRKQSEGDLHIYHYSQSVQVNPTLWTKEVLLARGIVLRVTSDLVEVVATPWPKFFNYMQDGIDISELTKKQVGWEVTNKMDGSMGLVFHDGHKWRVITKGSFSSDQSVWATKYLNSKVDTDKLEAGTTYLVEIIYLENTIVIAYDYEGLVLLSAFRSDGTEMLHSELQQVALNSAKKDSEGFRLVRTFSFESMKDLMEDVQHWDGRKFEGVVVRFLFANGASHRVKIKGEHYKSLHRVCTGITPKIILQALASSESELEALRNDTPEEFIDWFDNLVGSFRAQVAARIEDTRRCVEVARGQGCAQRGQLGRWLKGRQNWPDGRPVTRTQLKFIFPAFEDIGAFETSWLQQGRPARRNKAREALFSHLVVPQGTGSPSIRPNNMMLSQQYKNNNNCQGEGKCEEAVRAAAVVSENQLSKGQSRQATAVA